MEPGALLDVLLAAGGRSDRMTHVRHLPARAGTQADWPSWADADLVQGYRALGVDRPWLHQVEAADAAWSGRHTVLATSTGSGKSLAFWLPALSTARAASAGSLLDPGRIESVTRRATTLYLCPTKALAADQLAALDRLLVAGRTRDVRVSTCDGDTSLEERRWVQEHADVVLTNPDFLHFALLPQHRRWARLLGSLRVTWRGSASGAAHGSSSGRSADQGASEPGSSGGCHRTNVLRPAGEASAVTAATSDGWTPISRAALAAGSEVVADARRNVGVAP